MSIGSADMWEQLRRYLSYRLPGVADLWVSRPVALTVGLSRENWAFDAAWTEDGAPRYERYVLRRDPDVSLLATDRSAEFAVLKSVHGTRVPVPKPCWVESEPHWLGRPFIVMERIERGETDPRPLFSDQRYHDTRHGIARQMVEILADIHALDWGALGLAGLDRPESPVRCADREIARWETVVRRNMIEPQPVLEIALRWLGSHRPRPAQRISLLHGDFRPGNVMFNEKGEIPAILDWELAHLGDPLEDVGWLCMTNWRFGRDDRYVGLIAPEEFRRLYESRSGIELDDESLRFWQIFNTFKLACVRMTAGSAFVTGRSADIRYAIQGLAVAMSDVQLLDYLGL